MQSQLRRRGLILLSAFLVNLTIGTIGFVFICAYPPLDAAYMTLTTIFTIGYGELLPLDQTGRLFNSIFIAYAVVTQLVATGYFTQALVEWELQGGLGARRRQNMIRSLKDHYIVCGYGRVGRGAAEELARSGQTLVIVDKNTDRLKRAEQLGYLTYEGDSTMDETLKEVGIERAKGVIATLGTDADNLFLVISARAMNPDVPVVARAVEEEAIVKLKRAGAKEVKAPFRSTGQNLVNALVKPHVAEFLDFALMETGLNVAIEQIAVSANCPLAGRSLQELQLRSQLKVIVMAIRRADGAMEFSPEGSSLVAAGDHLIVMGNQEDLRKLEAMFAVEEQG